MNGRFMIELKGGKRVDIDFNARFVVVEVEEKVARLEFVQVWTDPTDMMAAQKRVKEEEGG